MKLNLRDLFWLVLVIAILCGWWVDQDRIRRESMALQAEREKLQALPLRQAEKALAVAEAELGQVTEIKQKSPRALSERESRLAELRRDAAQLDVEAARAKVSITPTRP